MASNKTYATKQAYVETAYKDVIEPQETAPKQVTYYKVVELKEGGYHLRRVTCADTIAEINVYVTNTGNMLQGYGTFR